jgi:hypothetical protein
MIIARADLIENETVKKYLSQVFDVTELNEVAHFLGNIFIKSSRTVSVTNPVTVKKPLADFHFYNPKKVFTQLDPSFVSTEKTVQYGLSRRSGKTAWGGQHL